MANDYRPRVSEAAFTSQTSPIDYPRDWDPYPMYLLREDVDLGGTGGGPDDTLSADKVVDGFAKVAMTQIERAKLAGIAPGANATNDLQIRKAFGTLLQAGPNVGIVFSYDDATDKLSAIVTGGAGGGLAVDVFNDPTDTNVLLWDTDTLEESDATIVADPVNTDELIWTDN